MINYPTYCPICGCEIYAKDKVPNTYRILGSDDKYLPPYTQELLDNKCPWKNTPKAMTVTMFHCNNCDKIFPINDKDCK
ncbi:hypothetical protein [Clostridium butyricum]|uniref:hypothetical protein n=1 Tax=Clostridium butyricum TaxID=1492 RepID=UPI002AAF55E9|nr:hypothetical protein [Clostridium butyricum]